MLLAHQPAALIYSQFIDAGQTHTQTQTQKHTNTKTQTQKKSKEAQRLEVGSRAPERPQGI